MAKKFILKVFTISSSSPSLYKKGTFERTPEQFIKVSKPPNLLTVFSTHFLAENLSNALYLFKSIFSLVQLLGSIMLPLTDSKSLSPILILFPAFSSLCAIFSPIPLLAPLIKIVLILIFNYIFGKTILNNILSSLPCIIINPFFTLQGALINIMHIAYTISLKDNVSVRNPYH